MLTKSTRRHGPSEQSGKQTEVSSTTARSSVEQTSKRTTTGRRLRVLFVSVRQTKRAVQTSVGQSGVALKIRYKNGRAIRTVRINVSCITRPYKSRSGIVTSTTEGFSGTGRTPAGVGCASLSETSPDATGLSTLTTSLGRNVSGAAVGTPPKSRGPAWPKVAKAVCVGATNAERLLSVSGRTGPDKRPDQARNHCTIPSTTVEDPSTVTDRTSTTRRPFDGRKVKARHGVGRAVQETHRAHM